MRARLAFSRDRRVSPVPSSTESSATSTCSPALTSTSPRSFLNCSSGNDGFGLQSDVDDDDVVGDFDDEPGEDHARADALVGETLFEKLGETFCHTFTSATQMACVYWIRVRCGPGKHNGHPHPARAFLGLPSPVRIATSGPQGHKRRAAPSSSTRCTTASTVRPVESMRHASGAAFSGATARVGSLKSRSAISRERAGRLTPDPLSFNCLWRRRALSCGAGGQEYLEAGLGENHSAHIPPVRHQPRGHGERPLARQERLTHGRPRGHPGGSLPRRPRSGSRRHIPSVERNALAAVGGDGRSHVHRRAQRCVSPLIVRGDALGRARQRDQAVERAAVEEVPAQRAARAAG